MMSTLVDKSYKDYSYTSRYSPFPYYYHTQDDKYVYGLTAYLNNTSLYQLYTVQQGDNLDNLALRFYGNPTLYWVICSFNQIRNPYRKLVPGTTLRIPALSNIQYDILGRS